MEVDYEDRSPRELVPTAMGSAESAVRTAEVDAAAWASYVRRLACGIAAAGLPPSVIAQHPTDAQLRLHEEVTPHVVHDVQPTFSSAQRALDAIKAVIAHAETTLSLVGQAVRVAKDEGALICKATGNVGAPLMDTQCADSAPACAVAVASPPAAHGPLSSPPHDAHSAFPLATARTVENPPAINLQETDTAMPEEQLQNVSDGHSGHEDVPLPVFFDAQSRGIERSSLCGVTKPTGISEQSASQQGSTPSALTSPDAQHAIRLRQQEERRRQIKEAKERYIAEAAIEARANIARRMSRIVSDVHGDVSACRPLVDRTEVRRGRNQPAPTASAGQPLFDRIDVSPASASPPLLSRIGPRVEESDSSSDLGEGTWTDQETDGWPTTVRGGVTAATPRAVRSTVGHARAPTTSLRRGSPSPEHSMEDMHCAPAVDRKESSGHCNAIYTPNRSQIMHASSPAVTAHRGVAAPTVAPAVPSKFATGTAGSFVDNASSSNLIPSSVLAPQNTLPSFVSTVSAPCEQTAVDTNIHSSPSPLSSRNRSLSAGTLRAPSTTSNPPSGRQRSLTQPTAPVNRPYAEVVRELLQSTATLNQDDAAHATAGLPGWAATAFPPSPPSPLYPGCPLSPLSSPSPATLDSAVEDAPRSPASSLSYSFTNAPSVLAALSPPILGPALVIVDPSSPTQNMANVLLDGSAETLDSPSAEMPSNSGCMSGKMAERPVKIEVCEERDSEAHKDVNKEERVQAQVNVIDMGDMLDDASHDPRRDDGALNPDALSAHSRMSRQHRPFKRPQDTLQALSPSRLCAPSAHRVLSSNGDSKETREPDLWVEVPPPPFTLDQYLPSMRDDRISVTPPPKPTPVSSRRRKPISVSSAKQAPKALSAHRTSLAHSGARAGSSTFAADPSTTIVTSSAPSTSTAVSSQRQTFPVSVVARMFGAAYRMQPADDASYDEAPAPAQRKRRQADGGVQKPAAKRARRK